MRISFIRVENFRVIKQASIDDVPRIFGIWGRNGSGKTALVQAVVGAVNTVRLRGHTEPPQQFNTWGLQMGGWDKVLWKGGTQRSTADVELRTKEPEMNANFRFGSGVIQVPGQPFPVDQVRYFPPQRSLMGRSSQIQSTPRGDLGVSPAMLHPFVHYYMHERMRDRINRGAPNEIDTIDSWLTKFGLGKLSDRTSGALVTATFVDPSTSFDTDFTDGGFGGVSIAPVVIEAFSFRDGVLLIEEPELSLHPAAQAELFDFFVDVAEHRNHQVIFTSHSTYLLGRMARYSRDNPGAPPDFLGVASSRKDEEGAHYSRESMADLVTRLEKNQPLLGDLQLRLST
jgi:hypothetical protein